MNRQAIAKLCALLLAAAAAAWVLLRSPYGAMLLSPDGRTALFGRLNDAVLAAGAWGPLVFILMMTAGLMALPATPFVLAGAILFGKYAGTLYNFAAAILAASLSFALGRYFLRDFARHFLVGRLARLDEKAGRHGFSVIFYLRLAWFPFIVLNYGAGATRIRFSDYFWGTVLGGAAPFAITTFCFGSFRDVFRDYRTPADLARFDVLFPVALLVLSLFLPRIVRRLRRGEVPEADGP